VKTDKLPIIDIGLLSDVECLRNSNSVPLGCPFISDSSSKKRPRIELQAARGVEPRVQQAAGDGDIAGPSVVPMGRDRPREPWAHSSQCGDTAGLVDASLPWLPRFLSAIRPLRLANTGLLTRGVVPQRQRRSAHNLGQEEWDKDTPPYGANALPVANAAWKRLVIPSEGTPTILMQKNRVLLFRAVQKFPRGGTADRGRQR
jgi:hypothetical protein